MKDNIETNVNQMSKIRLYVMKICEESRACDNNKNNLITSSYFCRHNNCQWKDRTIVRANSKEKDKRETFMRTNSQRIICLIVHRNRKSDHKFYFPKQRAYHHASIVCIKRWWNSMNRKKDWLEKRDSRNDHLFCYCGRKTTYLEKGSSFRLFCNKKGKT